MFKLIYVAASTVTLVYFSTSTGYADVYVKQLSKTNSVYVNQASGHPMMGQRQQAAAPNRQRNAQARQAAVLASQGARTVPLRINDFSQTGVTNKLSVPSVRGGVRVTADN
ncbi:MAG: hypothetical protein WBG95_15295 [Sulfitobacter sp.]